MDAQLKAKWVEALRSGEYKQGHSMLFNPQHKSYCCIGVLCMVAGLEIDTKYDRIVGTSHGDLNERYKPAVKLLGGHNVYEFTTRNDGVSLPGSKDEGREHSFAEIADCIEANL